MNNTRTECSFGRRLDCLLLLMISCVLCFLLYAVSLGKTAEELMGGEWSTPLLLERDLKHSDDNKDTRDWRSVSGGGSDRG